MGSSNLPSQSIQASSDYPPISQSPSSKNLPSSLLEQKLPSDPNEDSSSHVNSHVQATVLRTPTQLLHNTTPGLGTVIYSRRDGGQAGLETVEFSYPLKLIIPTPEFLQIKPSKSRKVDSNIQAKDGGGQNGKSEHPTSTLQLIHTIFILSYGGGLVGGDRTNLRLHIHADARIVLLTQGSTKIFKCLGDSGAILRTSSTLVADIHSSSAVVYLPDPVQPYANSSFDQTQVYRLHSPNANICVCDWACQGRLTRGECWDVFRYSSRNEFWAVGWGINNALNNNQSTQTRLLLRDNILLTDPAANGLNVSTKVGGMAVFGSLLISGPLFISLGRFFLLEFSKLARIGGKDWGSESLDGSDTTNKKPTSEMETWRSQRTEFEHNAGIVWTATSTRGFVIVKFGAPQVEVMREWLYVMLLKEGTLMAQFGARPLYCLKTQ